MSKVDLHVHTRHSDRPSEWFLRRIGAAESYTDPEWAYRAAKARGMDFVAITDHNSIAGALEVNARHPRDTIVGVELTTYFPEDGCKVHVLAWGVDERQFALLDEARSDIYVLRDVLRAERIAHGVAHATYSINDRLTADHLEKLVLMFDNFETLNGSRSAWQNRQWHTALEHLTPRLLDRLAVEHGISPASDRPWIKGFTGGSDDHAGLFVGATWTECAAKTPEAFLDAVRARQTVPGGRYNDFRGLAFSIYRIAYEYSQIRTESKGRSLLDEVTRSIFGPGKNGGSPLLRGRLALASMNGDETATELLELLDSAREFGAHFDDARLDRVYDVLTRLSDNLLSKFLDRLQGDVLAGDFGSVGRGLTSALPAAFLAAPFFSTLGVLSRGRAAGDEFALRHGLSSKRQKRTMWFTDTYDDVNGVSMTLQQVARLAARRGDDLRIVAALDPATERDLPPTVMNLDHVFDFELPFYEMYTLRIPSMLRALRTIDEFRPDAIIVSTPGPVGLLGLGVGRLLGLPVSMVYHTDFSEQVKHISEDESVSDLVETLNRWVYGLADEVLVPTEAYRGVLETRGYQLRSSDVFRRGIDLTSFVPGPSPRERLRERYGFDEAPVLLSVGRVSREKGLGFLLDVFERLNVEGTPVNLLVVGDGPYRDELAARAAGLPRCVVAGEVEHADLPDVYAGADLLAFPSTTDTFGMVVLEAHACSLPCLVSDVGGPQEIVVEGETGHVLPAWNADAWAAAIRDALSRMADDPEAHEASRRAARRRAVEHDWNGVLDRLLEWGDVTVLGAPVPTAGSVTATVPA